MDSQTPDYMDLPDLDFNVAETPSTSMHLVLLVFLCIVYATIFFLGIFGNALVCFVVLRNKDMYTVTNFFILNLALSCILLCTVKVPGETIHLFIERWIFGKALCHLLPFFQEVGLYVISWTLTALAIERFLVVVFPSRAKMTLRTSVVTICVIWIFSSLVASPYGIFVALEDYGHLHCVGVWPNLFFYTVFNLSTIILNVMMPLIIVAIIFIKLFMTLSGRAESSYQEERNTNCMLITMVVIFACTSLPLLMLTIIVNFSLGYLENFYIIVPILVAVYSSIPCYYPFVYAWFNEKFRQEFKKVLVFICCKKNRNPSVTSVRTNKDGNPSTVAYSVITESTTIHG